MQHSSSRSEQLAFARALAEALNRLNDEAAAHGTMWEIRQRHGLGCSTPEDRRTYHACWRAVSLRRSIARRSCLPTEVERVLARRAWLTAQIRDEQTRLAVESVFLSPPEGETDVADTEPASR